MCSFLKISFGRGVTLLESGEAQVRTFASRIRVRAGRRVLFLLYIISFLLILSTFGFFPLAVYSLNIRLHTFEKTASSVSTYISGHMM